jgi:hypothetical protein
MAVMNRFDETYDLLVYPISTINSPISPRGTIAIFNKGPGESADLKRHVCSESLARKSFSLKLDRSRYCLVAADSLFLSLGRAA